jgi:stress-induced morphogen
MEKWVKEIINAIDDSRVVLDGQEGSCSRICKVISNSFKDMSILNRHRSVKKVLEKHFAESLHALSIQTYTEEEWENARPNK